VVVGAGAGAAVHPVPRHHRVKLLVGRALRRPLSRGGAAVVLAATVAAEAGQRRVCGHPAVQAAEAGPQAARLQGGHGKATRSGVVLVQACRSSQLTEPKQEANADLSGCRTPRVCHNACSAHPGHSFSHQEGG